MLKSKNIEFILSTLNQKYTPYSFYFEVRNQVIDVHTLWNASERASLKFKLIP